MGEFLIDCHAHLDELEDLPGALERAARAGVGVIVAVSLNSASSRETLRIAGKYTRPEIIPAIGLYPDEVTPEEIEKILSLIDREHARIRALGEIGLDYWIKPLRKKQPHREEVKALQQEAFRLQLERAKKYDLPAIIHSRGAWSDCYGIVKESGLQRAVFHWYTGPLDLLEDILAAGYFVSAPPAAAGSPPLRAVLSAAPLERIILETDSPVPRREGEKRIPTGPADVRISLAALAELKGISPEEAAAATSRTARQLFLPSGGKDFLRSLKK